MLCKHDGTLRSVHLAEEPGFGTSPALVPPAAVAPACSQGLAPPSEGGCHGGSWVFKRHGPGAWAGGCPRAGGALGEEHGLGGEQGGLRLLQILETQYRASFQRRSLINLVIMCCQL